jgi:hypothetical protein
MRGKPLGLGLGFERRIGDVGRRDGHDSSSTRSPPSAYSKAIDSRT